MNLAIDQFTEERFGLVTGSRCSPLFPLRGDGEKGQRTLARELASEMYFKFYDEFGNRHTEHGTMAEAFAFEYYGENFDGEIEKGRWVRKGSCGGSTDAEAKLYGVDFKCPTSLHKWLDYLYLPIDHEQEQQCQMYMYLTKKENWKIAAFLQETQFMSDNGLTYPVPQNKRMIVVNVPRQSDWVQRLSETLPKVITWRDEYYAILKKQFDGSN